MKFQLLKILILFLVIISLSSCSNSIYKSNLFTTYFVGEEGNQFFIKPLEFEHIENNSKLDLDINFRYKNKIKDSVTINFSLYSNDFLKNIDFVELYFDKESIKSNNIKLIYVDKNNDFCENRYSVKFLFSDFLKIYNLDLSLNVNYQNYNNIYIPKNLTRGKLEVINKKLITLLN